MLVLPQASVRLHQCRQLSRCKKQSSSRLRAGGRDLNELECKVPSAEELDVLDSFWQARGVIDPDHRKKLVQHGYARSGAGVDWSRGSKFRSRLYRTKYCIHKRVAQMLTSVDTKYEWGPESLLPGAHALWQVECNSTSLDLVRSIPYNAPLEIDMLIPKRLDRTLKDAGSSSAFLKFEQS